MRIKIFALVALSLTALLALGVQADSKPLKRGAQAHHRSNASQSATARGHARPMAAVVRAESDDGNVTARHVTISAARHRPMFGWPALVTEARKYLGTNPTKRTKLWCATFMNMVLKRVGYPGTGSDAARSFASYGRRINEPKIGAIAVLTRGKHGGHVGVVTGIDKHGNPIIISGNHGRKVGVGVYPRSRVIAYVMPVGTPQSTQVALASQASTTVRAAAPANANNEEGGIPSPITELLAAINNEEPGDNRGQAQARPARQQPAQEQARAQAPPHRVVQQVADNETVQANFVRPLPAQRPAPAAAPRRDLPLDPALARFLGVKPR